MLVALLDEQPTLLFVTIDGVRAGPDQGEATAQFLAV
jgi:hypothetical protein